MALRLIIVLVFISVNGCIYGQGKYDVNLQSYLDRIDKLVDGQLAKNPERFEEKKLLQLRLNSVGKDKVDAYLNLYEYYVYKSTESAQRYNDEALDLAKVQGLEEEYLKATLNQAFIFFIQGEFEKTMELIDEIERNNRLSDYPKIQVDREALKSYVFTERGEYDTALKTTLGLLEQSEELQEPYHLMKAYSAVSHVYLRLGEYEKALDYCLKGLEFVLQLEMSQYLFPKIDEIARMTLRLEGSRKALAIYDFYLRLEEKIPAPGSYIQSVVYMNIADLYSLEGKLEKAAWYLERALLMIDADNYRFRKPRAHGAMAELHLKMGDTVGSIKSYRKAFNAAEEIHAYDVIKEVSGSLAILYESTGNVMEASSFRELHNAISDSLFSEESEQRIKILDARRKINEISREKEILEIKTASQEERYRLILFILFLTVVLGVIAVFSYYKVKRKNRLLFDRTKELTEVRLHRSKKENQVIGTSHSTANKVSADEDYIDEAIKNIILTKLERLENDNFFLDPKCSLHFLSDELQTNQKYLSLVINNEKKSNFNTYVNNLRIDFLLKRLLNDVDFRNSKLSYISKASGFNNQNTFYSAFKRRFGILPSYFIKELNGEEKH